MEKRVIPTKNYIIFAVMSIFVIIAVLYTANYYAMSRDYYLDYSYVSGVISNIDEASFNNFVKESPEIVVYIANSKDSSIKSFEKKFKKLIINNDIKQDIIYLDSNHFESEGDINAFISKYYSQELKKHQKELVVPNLIYFKDGEIVNVLYSNNASISIDDVKSFLVDCEVINVD